MLGFLSNYGTFVFIGIGFAVAIVLIWQQRTLLKISTKRKGLLLATCMMLFGPLSISGFWNISNWLIPGMLHSGIFGLFFFGPVLMLGCARLLKLKARHMMDIFACVMSIYQILNRISCHIAGCCQGIPLFGTSIRWPARELEQLFFFIMFVILWKMLKEKKNQGLLFSILTIAYGSFRFVNEWLSVGDHLILGIQIAHIWAVLMVFLGFSLYFEIREQPKKTRRLQKQ